jgi:hypothetical protein
MELDSLNLYGMRTFPAPEPMLILRFLAKSIIFQYQLVKKGYIVGDLDPSKNMPLQQAMAHLGRLYLTERKEDQAASVHHLLQLCMQPIAQWAPQAIASLEPYREAILIDPDYCVPSEDCEAIAEELEGVHLSDLIERQLHEQLTSALKKLGSDVDWGYTTVREFIVRHPLATRVELAGLSQNPELTNEVIELVRDLYRPVHAVYAHNGLVRRCSFCQCLLDQSGHCILAGCRQDHPHPHTNQNIQIDEAFIVRPEVLKFWVDPAREELRIYDSLRILSHLQGKVKLYPHSDRCDISIDDVGIDVKDYQDPVRLAYRLNRSLGGLSYYSTKILAIAQRRWSRVYQDRLLEQLDHHSREVLQVMSVDQVINMYKRGKRKNHVRET